MSDITFMKGYGFPRGSRMDYAGYGALVNSRRRGLSTFERIPVMPEPSIFEKIPALDGIDGSFGTEYTFEEDEISAGPVYGPEYRPDELRKGGDGLLWGLGALAALWFFTR